MKKAKLLIAMITLIVMNISAQNITVNASIGLADDQCNPVIIDPNTDCIAVPLNQNTLTYLPGQDSNIIITYRLTNNSVGTTTMGSIMDSDRGVIVVVKIITTGEKHTDF